MKMALKNGAKVLCWVAKIDGAVVLAEWRNQFVTWLVNTEGNAFLGHYFDSYSEAVREFMVRSGLNQFTKGGRVEMQSNQQN